MFSNFSSCLLALENVTLETGLVAVGGGEAESKIATK
jgi:hypothetical protein